MDSCLRRNDGVLVWPTGEGLRSDGEDYTAEGVEGTE